VSVPSSHTTFSGPRLKENNSGDVAQLVRALPCHGRGRGFEPRRPRHTFQSTYGMFGYQVTIKSGFNIGSIRTCTGFLSVQIARAGIAHHLKMLGLFAGWSMGMKVSTWTGSRAP
jgi:hypothetical protein